MSDQTVKEQVERWRERIADLEGQIGVARAEIRRLQNICKHPNCRSSRDYTGELGTYCPDCGATAL